MIIVTGATGQLGRTIVEQLVARVPSGQVGVSVREPAKASALAELGVRVRKGDFAQPDTLATAFAGATQVLIVSSNAGAYGGDTLTQHRQAIAAARAVGVRRIVYTSHMAARDTSAFLPARHHAATEVMLRESGVAWTALRNGFYLNSGLAMMGDALQTGVLAVPLDGQVSWTTHEDLAEAAAIILAEEGRFEGPTPPLTAGETLDLGGLAEVVSTRQGKAVRREVVTDDALRAKMAAAGAPSTRAEIALGFFVASRNGEFAAVDPALQQLLGRRPKTAREVLGESP